jgi:hypothetical protein
MMEQMLAMVVQVAVAQVKQVPLEVELPQVDIQAVMVEMA